MINPNYQKMTVPQLIAEAQRILTKLDRMRAKDRVTLTLSQEAVKSATSFWLLDKECLKNKKFLALCRKFSLIPANAITLINRRRDHDSKAGLRMNPESYFTQNYIMLAGSQIHELASVLSTIIFTSTRGQSLPSSLSLAPLILKRLRRECIHFDLVPLEPVSLSLPNHPKDSGYRCRFHTDRTTGPVDVDAFALAVHSR